MTRAQAISILSRPRTMKNTPSDILETHEMAIKALEQEPCEDAIRRQAAIDAIENEQKKIMRSDWAIDQAKFSAMSEIRALIADLPSVSTEKTGLWIEQEGYDGDTYYDCSECGESFCLIDGTPTDNLYNYCPNCGCKMGVKE